MSGAVSMDELFGGRDGDFKYFESAMIYGIDGQNSDLLDPPQYVFQIQDLISWIDDYPDITGFRHLIPGDQLWAKPTQGALCGFTVIRENLRNPPPNNRLE